MLTTGMLMFGKISVGVRSAASAPMIRIKIANTTNVYGRLSASRTIHINDLVVTFQAAENAQQLGERDTASVNAIGLPSLVGQMEASIPNRSSLRMLISEDKREHCSTPRYVEISTFDASVTRGQLNKEIATYCSERYQSYRQRNQVFLRGLPFQYIRYRKAVPAGPEHDDIGLADTAPLQQAF